MSIGFKNNKTLFLDTEEIYWKNLKNNKTYIFYITRKEKEFFYTNFKNDRLMFFYLFLKYLCRKTRFCEFESSFIRDCFNIKFRQDLKNFSSHHFQEPISSKLSIILQVINGI